MKRKVVLLIVGFAFLILIYLAIHSSLRPRYFAAGRIFLNLQLVDPNESAGSNWNLFYSQPSVSNWYGHSSDPSVVSNLLNNSERMTTLIRDSAALTDNIQLADIHFVRGTSLVAVRFGGDDKDAVWRVTSNACVMLVGFYATNLPSELQTTNQVTREVRYIDTGFWTPTPLWRRMLDDVEDLFERLRN